MPIKSKKIRIKSLKLHNIILSKKIIKNIEKENKNARSSRQIVANIFGGQSAIFSRIIYTVVTLSAIWCISLLFKSENNTTGTS